MKKLSEYENEDALDLLGDLIEPIGNFCADKKFEKIFKEGSKIKIIQYCLKTKARQKDILTILARLEGVPLSDYKANIFSLPVKLIELWDDEELVNFFVSQGFGMGNESSGSATENTEAIEPK